MCGIAGIFTVERRATPADVAAVRLMMEAQVHRGPDGEDLYQAPHAVFGHRRLSIIDLSPSGAQPMSNEDGTVWVTYNGEIYNFQQLRQELSHEGHSFKSKADTEILVHGYEEWGIEGLLGRLRGMFAFALYDERLTTSPRIFLVKDRFGIKPLYYSNLGNAIVFASEVRAVLRSGLVPNESNPEALIRFLQLGSLPIPLTTVKSIQALPAAHYALIDGQGFRLKQYWDLCSLFTHEAPSFEDAVERTRTLLDESVQLHLISDVPLGVFLSGGLDSSALVALASRFQDRPLTTVSIAFEEALYSEAPYARLVAERYHTDHYEVLLNGKDFYENLPAIFQAMDQPTVDGVNTFTVSKAAKDIGLKVVLSGLGADEIFLGYEHLKNAYRWNQAWRCLRSMPVLVRKMGVALALGALRLTRRMGAERLAYLDNPTCENIYLMCRGLFSAEQVQSLLAISREEVEGAFQHFYYFNGDQQSRLGDSVCFFEFKQYLQSQLLRDTDVMSMAHSLETRVPFLDHLLVEHVASLPLDMKFHRRKNKPMLISAIGRSVPREIWDRPKMGFTFPFASWLREHAVDFEARSKEQGILSPQAVGKLWAEFQAGNLHWSRVWATVVAGQFCLKT
jgi:asparagine synthase (glutamine-hydrolysing)